MNNVIIKSADEIDLGKHGVIEAHAGTGKTYAIVNLVLRMLEEPASAGAERFIHLRDIMLVTYTEKAGGELKKRIQDGIIPRITELRASKKNDALAAHLENCLNNMHEAFIGTIHSVCLRLLQTWPFETGVHFNTQIVNDEDNIRLILRESMRSDWQDENTQIPQTLKKLGELEIHLKEKHFKLIEKTANKLLMQMQNENDNAVIDKTLETDEVYEFIYHTAHALASRYHKYKKQNALISYNDMLQLTRDAIYEDNGIILKTLRERLRYLIIDEFQDTNPTQWSIFKKIFLDTPKDAPRINTMYIVGDPKQSIYSFQNVDIRSYINAKETISKLGGSVYSLVENYRSLPQMINGYNAILCQGEKDWFCFDGESGISYPQELAAREPKRDSPKFPLRHRAIQVVTINNEGSADDKRTAFAAVAAEAIKKLRGTKISVPKGLVYEDITLDYKDFAVIIENNDYAIPFIDEFQKHGIPCMKYKMRGVFESALALDFIALLKAIVNPCSHSHRTLALLTHFFNIQPDFIDPARVLSPCENDACADNQCIAHTFEYLSKLAKRQLWAQLFENIFTRTNIRQRLLQLVDGERKLADLRQVTDYCVEYLYGQNSNLEQLIIRLERLSKQEDSAEEDKNLHVLATEKSSVTILTMHASKGLEFPVVFVMNNSDFKMRKGPEILSWADGDGKLKFSPYLGIAKGSPEYKKLGGQIALCKQDMKRERQRLLYVAMTRAQAMLFVPMHEKTNTPDDDLFKEDTLSVRLKNLLLSGSEFVELFDIKNFNDAHCAIESNTKKNEPTISLADIPKLSLKNFIVHETSYTGISNILKERGKKEISTNANDVLPANEFHSHDIFEDETTGLPKGRLTGIALHAIIETVLKADDISALLESASELDIIAEKHLRQNGVLNSQEIQNQTVIIQTAKELVVSALTTPYTASAKGELEQKDIVVKTLAREDIISEAEFLFALAPHRVRGSMDLLFRVRNDAHKQHPYRYYFIDWKSDTLKNYDDETLLAHCRECNYGLQSKIYAYALDKYLRGILGEKYSQSENLGASIYVFLRGNGAFIREELAAQLANPLGANFISSIY